MQNLNSFLKFCYKYFGTGIPDYNIEGLNEYVLDLLIDNPFHMQSSFSYKTRESCCFCYLK